MACCHCPLRSSLLPSSHLPNRPQIRIAKRHSSQTPSISSDSEAPQRGGGGVEDRKKKSHQSHLSLLELSVTLTVVSSSLPQQSLAAAPKVAKKRAASKKPGAKKHKPEAALSPQELKLWSQGLPLVSDRVSYTEVLELKREGKLKHLIKPSTAALKKKPEVVIVVLDDLRALRTVLPSMERDEKFWASWEELGVGSVCVNAYSPPLKAPELPSPYLGFVSAVLEYGLSLTKPRPVSKQALKVKKLREELKREKEVELRRSREEAEMVKKAIRNEKKMEARNRRIEQRKKQPEQSQANSDYQEMANFWVDLSMDQNVVFLHIL